MPQCYNSRSESIQHHRQCDSGKLTQFTHTIKKKTKQKKFQEKCDNVCSSSWKYMKAMCECCNAPRQTEQTQQRNAKIIIRSCLHLGHAKLTWLKALYNLVHVSASRANSPPKRYSATCWTGIVAWKPTFDSQERTSLSLAEYWHYSLFPKEQMPNSVPQIYFFMFLR